MRVAAMQTVSKARERVHASTTLKDAHGIRVHSAYRLRLAMLATSLAPLVAATASTSALAESDTSLAKY
eukprot:scaffold8214_cov121-Isochrysis_galbana.AAC.18